MPKSRLPLLSVVCVGLGALLWLDQRGAGISLPFFRHADPSMPTAGNERLGAVPSRQTNDAIPIATRLDNPLASLDKAALKHWVERPLFASSRQRPPPPPKTARRVQAAQPAATPKPKPPSYVLLGTLSNGSRAIALLRKEGDNTSFRVEAGDMIGGWHVARVEPKSVLLEREDGTSHSVPLNGN